MDGLKEKYCPKCKEGHCIRSHEPARHTGTGLRDKRILCSKCGKTRYMTVLPNHDDAGEQICNQCSGNSTRFNKYGTCCICGNKARIKLCREDGGEIGKCCYHPPIEKCYFCRQPKEVALQLQGKYPICHKCYIEQQVPKYPCGICGKEKQTAKWVDDKPVCFNCYTKHHVPRFNCAECGQSRPVAKWLDGRGGNRPICSKCYKKQRRQNKAETTVQELMS